MLTTIVQLPTIGHCFPGDCDDMTSSVQQTFQQAVSEEFSQVDSLIAEQLRTRVDIISKIGHYIVQAGGKRLRPLLVLLVARATHYRDEHIPLAVIIEFLHTATLLHDDVVDQSDLRRGRNTANILWGNAPSVLVGDFLYSRTFQMMVELGSLPILKILSDSTNVIAEGEVMQLMNIHNTELTEQDYMETIRCKTARLFEASTHSSAVLSAVDSDKAEALRLFGHHLGMTFQLVDDLLDYEGDQQKMGKNIGDDLAEGKPTLPLIYLLSNGTVEERTVALEAIKHGGTENIEVVAAATRSSGALEYTRDKAKTHCQQALTLLESLDDSPYRQALQTLTRFALERQH